MILEIISTVIFKTQNQAKKKVCKIHSIYLEQRFFVTNLFHFFNKDN